MFFYLFLQERQRLETILNLCAEYNKGESTLDPLGSGRTGFPGGLTEGLVRRPSLENVLGGTASPASLRLVQRQRESDEENLKEECSSTESTHQEVRTSPAPCTASALHNGDRQVRGGAASQQRRRLHAAVGPAWVTGVHGFANAVQRDSGTTWSLLGDPAWVLAISLLQMSVDYDQVITFTVWYRYFF